MPQGTNRNLKTNWNWNDNIVAAPAVAGTLCSAASWTLRSCAMQCALPWMPERVSVPIASEAKQSKAEQSKAMQSKAMQSKATQKKAKQCKRSNAFKKVTNKR